jgi:hypothetical protein
MSVLMSLALPCAIAPATATLTVPAVHQPIRLPDDKPEPEHPPHGEGSGELHIHGDQHFWRNGAEGSGRWTERRFPSLRGDDGVHIHHLDHLVTLRKQARHELLAASRKHPACRPLREIPSIGPIRAAVLHCHRPNSPSFSHQAAALGLQRPRSGDAHQRGLPLRCRPTATFQEAADHLRPKHQP